MQINNNNFQKNANTSLVAKLIWRKPTISRVEIARELNLYRSTVTNIVASLIENKIVCESEAAVDNDYTKTGRKPIILHMNQKFGCVIGCDIQPSHYRLVVIAIDGEVLESQNGALPDTEFSGVIDFLVDQSIQLVQKLRIPLLGICLGFPGIVDVENGIIEYAEPFKVEHFDLFDYFKQRYNIPVLMENDANCCAWLEMTLSRRKTAKDFLCIIADKHEGNYQFHDRSGIGIGMGLAIGGKVYHGHQNAAGEFYAHSWQKDFVGQMGLPEEILKAAGTDLGAWTLMIKELFSSLVPIISVFDPAVVFLLGRPFSDHEQTLKLIKEQAPQFLDMLEKINCRLEFHNDDEMAVAKGAAMMYLQKIFAVPELSETEERTHFNWDDVIAQSKRSLDSYRK